MSLQDRYPDKILIERNYDNDFNIFRTGLPDFIKYRELYNLQNVQGDGNCFFYSVLHALRGTNILDKNYYEGMNGKNFSKGSRIPCNQLKLRKLFKDLAKDLYNVLPNGILKGYMKEGKDLPNTDWGGLDSQIYILRKYFNVCYVEYDGSQGLWTHKTYSLNDVSCKFYIMLYGDGHHFQIIFLKEGVKKRLQEYYQKNPNAKEIPKNEVIEIIDDLGLKKNNKQKRIYAKNSLPKSPRNAILAASLLYLCVLCYGLNICLSA